MNVAKVKQLVQKVLIEDLHLQEVTLLGDSEPSDTPGTGPVGEVNIVLSKPKTNGTQRLSVKIFHQEDEFLMVGFIDPALQIVSIDLYKKTASRILEIE